MNYIISLFSILFISHVSYKLLADPKSANWTIFLYFIIYGIVSLLSFDYFRKYKDRTERYFLLIISIYFAFTAIKYLFYIGKTNKELWSGFNNQPIILYGFIALFLLVIYLVFKPKK
jgi:uncharacterized membrane protein